MRGLSSRAVLSSAAQTIIVYLYLLDADGVNSIVLATYTASAALELWKVCAAFRRCAAIFPSSCRVIGWFPVCRVPRIRIQCGYSSVLREPSFYGLSVKNRPCFMTCTDGTSAADHARAARTSITRGTSNPNREHADRRSE